MTGRALVFSRPDFQRLLTEKLIPYAGDQWYLHRQQDDVGTFFWKVVQQGHYKDRSKDTTRQGIYVATADGTLLGSGNTNQPERMLAMVQDALKKWEQHPRAPLELAAATTLDTRFERKPPEKGLILKTYSRIVLPKKPDEPWTPNDATGRDHVWLTREEWRSLLPAVWRDGESYPLPPAVAERLLRFHLVDNVRGEPPMWQRRDIQQAKLMLHVENAKAGRLRLEGTVRLRHGDGAGERGYEARLQGRLIFDRTADHWKQFDLLAWGEAWGEGTYTRGAPTGKFLLVIAALLADPQSSSLVPPQASRDLREYFRTGDS